MDFGLGLVLSFTDNASAGINSAVNSLNQLTSVAESASSSLNQMASLSALSVVTDRLGSSFLNMGNNILSSFGNVISTLNQTGQTLMYAELQFDKLYEGSSKTGKDVLAEIQEYAKRSIFEFEDLIPSVVMLKANGIEAFDAIGKSIEGADLNLMDYAADLAAFNPQMRNMYGTGIKAAMGALNEYIAEGNAKSLKSGASLDITGILGEDKGKTIEERTDQIVRLMEKLNMVGMVSSMEGRPEQMLSNMGDVLFDLKGRIANSGVYEEFSKLIGIVAEFVFSLTDSELDSLASTIGGALSSIMKPVQFLAEKLVGLATSLKDVLIQNPTLAKMITIVTALGGAFAVVIGVILKATSAFSGLSLMMLTMGNSFSSIGDLIRTVSLKILATLIPLVATLGLLALAWRIDFAGIQTNTKYYLNGISTSFKTARQSVNGSVSDMITTLEQLRNKDDFFSNLTIGMMKVIMFFRALSEAWNTYTLSDDTFNKAKELGILPLIEAILDLKYRFDFFKQGFIDGWREIGDKVKTVVDNLLNSLDGTFLGDMIDKFTSFLQIFSGSDTQAWYDFGKSFAEYTAKAVVMFAVFSQAKKIINILGGITTVLKPLLGLVMAHPIVALIIGVVTALGILYAKSEKFRDIVNSVIEKIGGKISDLITTVVSIFISILPTIINTLKTIGGLLLTVFKIIGKVIEVVVPFILDIAKQCFGLITDIIPIIIDLISDIANAVMNFIGIVLPIIETIVQALMPIIHTILNIISSIVAKLVPIIKSVVGIVVNIIKAIIAIVMPIITVVMQIVEAIIVLLAPIVDIILQAVGLIIDIILGIIQVVVSVIENIVAIITGIVNVIMSIVNAIMQIIMASISVVVGFVTVIVDTITAVISSIISVVQTVWDFIVNTFSNALGFFSDVFTSIAEVISNVFNGIADFFTSVWDGIVTTFATLGDTISEAIKSAVNNVIGGAVKIINGFIKAINTAISIINAIPGVEIKKLTELSVPALAQGGVVDKPTTALIGEAGTEAVVPLENNTEWLGKLASMLVSEVRNITPTNNSVSSASSNRGESQYLSNSTTNNSVVQGSTDNSITFNEGAIQINCQNASEDEAVKMAKKIMDYIKRQSEIDKMMNYAI